MGELVADPNQISPIVAILWCFYPMAALVLIELILVLSTQMMMTMTKAVVKQSQCMHQQELNMYQIAFVLTLAVYTYTNAGQFLFSNSPWYQLYVICYFFVAVGFSAGSLGLL